MHDVISATAPDHKVRVVHYSDTKFALLYNGQYITLQNFWLPLVAIVWICDSVCLSVCDKTKTAETKITKLGTDIVSHDTSSTN